MANSTIALIIVGIALVLFATEKLPIVLTALLAMLAMYYTGIATASEAFSGFANTGTLITLAMMIVGGAFIQTGIASKLCSIILKWSSKGEKRNNQFTAMLTMVVASILGFFINGAAVFSMLMPVANQLERETKGELRRKSFYLPVAAAGTYGGLFNAAALSGMVAASGLLESSSFGRTFNYLEPAKIAIGAVVLFYLFYGLVGYKWMSKRFNSEPLEMVDASAEDGKQLIEFDQKKGLITVAVVALSVVGFAFTDYNMAMIGMAAAAILMLTNCISTKDAIKAVSWNTIVIMACCIGFAKAFEVSGAAEVVANFAIGIMGPLGQNSYAMCCLMLILTCILSNFMSNTAAAVAVVPLAFSVANTLGASLLPFALACGVGTNLAIATPICNSTITMTLACGYKFSDYIKYGGMLNLMGIIGSCVMLKLVFFL